MTIEEKTGERDLQMSQWIRKNLPDSKTGLWVSDLDFIIYYNKQKVLILLEIKRFSKKQGPWQRKMFENLDRWIRKGIDKDWIYLGYHLIEFENSFFHDGKVYFDNKEKTEDEIKSLLSL